MIVYDILIIFRHGNGLFEIVGHYATVNSDQQASDLCLKDRHILTNGEEFAIEERIQ